VPKQLTDEKRRREEIRKSRIASTLRDGPRTLDGIIDYFYGYLKVIGLFRLAQRSARRQESSIRKTLDELLERGWVTRDGELYALTPQGRDAVAKRMLELGQIGAAVRKFLVPQNASKVTLSIHLGLVAIKIPAALLSGSVGLLNDAIDTLLDAVSSTLVYLGFRFDKERVVNLVLVILMLTTGVTTFYEAVRRFFVATKFEVSWFTFLAAILSACICLALWAYQRFVGLQGGSIALITQSVDSRNHVIVAASVTLGLLASLLRFPLLDTLVGLTVSILILKSAIELTVEVIRSLGEEEVDLSSYEFGLAVQFDKFRESHLRDWVLYLVDREGIRTRAELVRLGCQALDTSQVFSLQAMGLAQEQHPPRETVERSLSELVKRGWLVGNEQMSVTDAGKKRLRRWFEKKPIPTL
jgi:DNA-binding PadR family transcriptional regulator